MLNKISVLTLISRCAGIFLLLVALHPDVVRAQLWKSYTAVDGLVDNLVIAMEEADDGALWLAPLEPGSAVSTAPGRLSRWPTGLADDYVRALLATAEGSLWMLPFFENGISRFDGQSWQTFTVADGLAGERVFRMLEASDGSLWVAADGGVSRFNGGTWQSFTVADELAGSTVRNFKEGTDGSLWVATDGGVSRYDGQSWQTFTMADGRWPVDLWRPRCWRPATAACGPHLQRG